MLSYASEGAFHRSDVLDMEPEERHWNMKRLAKQLEDEAKASKSGGGTRRGNSRFKK